MLQSMSMQRVEHDLEVKQQQHFSLHSSILTLVSQKHFLQEESH